MLTGSSQTPVIIHLRLFPQAPLKDRLGSFEKAILRADCGGGSPVRPSAVLISGAPRAPDELDAHIHAIDSCIFTARGMHDIPFYAYHTRSRRAPALDRECAAPTAHMRHLAWREQLLGIRAQCNARKWSAARCIKPAMASRVIVLITVMGAMIP